MSINKPSRCPDAECRCIINNPGGHAYVYGKSLECIGHKAVTERHVIFGVEHINDLNHCHWSPRGWTRFSENAGDLEVSIALMIRASYRMGKRINPGWLKAIAEEEDK